MRRRWHEADLCKNPRAALVYLAAMEIRSEHWTHIFVRMTGEPGVIERLFGPLTVSSLIPHRMVMRRHNDDSVFVLARFIGVDPDRAAYIVAKLRAMPCVRNAKLCVHTQALTSKV
jgi:hypothetical protein